MLQMFLWNLYNGLINIKIARVVVLRFFNGNSPHITILLLVGVCKILQSIGENNKINYQEYLILYAIQYR